MASMQINKNNRNNGLIIIYSLKNVLLSLLALLRIKKNLPQFHLSTQCYLNLHSLILNRLRHGFSTASASYFYWAYIQRRDCILAWSVILSVHGADPIAEVKVLISAFLRWSLDLWNQLLGFLNNSNLHAIISTSLTIHILYIESKQFI
jgi:hypothetical protein